MPKVTLDREMFKALASDTRLNILRSLDGKSMSLKQISAATNLNKATLHEHLSKLHEAGLVKRKEREGHKWVFYKLSWKGESLLHPENTKIVVLFSMTFVALWVGVIQLYWFVQGSMTNLRYSLLGSDRSNLSLSEDASSAGKGAGMDGSSVLIDGNQTIAPLYESGDSLRSLPENARLILDTGDAEMTVLYQDPTFLYIALACFAVFTIILVVSLWRLWENKTPQF